jgi:AhpC/TSA family
MRPRTSLLLSVLVCTALFALPATTAAQSEHPTLAIGAPAPDFCLPGVDGQTHCLKDYASSKILVVAFICNHCPTSQLYETRIK